VRFFLANSSHHITVIKTRPVADRTIDSRVVELPWNVLNPNGERRQKGDPLRWRHMKLAAGENIRRVYNQVRLDSIWQLRSSLSEATILKRKQDSFCERALQAHSNGKVMASSNGEVEQFPDDLKVEAFVDVLRGRVRFPISFSFTVLSFAIVTDGLSLHTGAVQQSQL
jgi:hypothetical protein